MANMTETWLNIGGKWVSEITLAQGQDSYPCRVALLNRSELSSGGLST